MAIQIDIELAPLICGDMGRTNLINECWLDKVKTIRGSASLSTVWQAAEEKSLLP
jgi:hypothetical protein